MSETTLVKKSLQDYADTVVAATYKQPLKTVREAVAAVGWEFDDVPVCCGANVKMRSMFGDAYFAQCEACGRFVVDVTGPLFSDTGSSVRFIDRDTFPPDTDWARSWIAGQESRP